MLATLCLAVASCSPADRQRAVYGAGIDLYTSDIAQATRNLDTYLGYLCEQAALDCYNSPMGEQQWAILVATGWNDIDRRCDAYLAWLENQRQQTKFVLAGFGHVRTLTTGIFGVITPSPATVAIVGLALGFSQDIYSAYQNRILLEIEGSTVETIVIEHRIKFRQELSGVRIYFKPDAVRLLRDYLRICTPYAIRTSINTYSRTFVTGGRPAERMETEQLRQSLISSIVKDVNAPLKPPPEAPVVQDAVRVGRYEQRLLPNDIIVMQQAVCLPPDGGFTATTKQVILNFLRETGKKDTSFPDRITAIDGARLRDVKPNC